LGRPELSIPFRIPVSSTRAYIRGLPRRLSIPFRIPEAQYRVVEIMREGAAFNSFPDSRELAEEIAKTYEVELSIPFRIPDESGAIVIFLSYRELSIPFRIPGNAGLWSLLRGAGTFQFLSGFQISWLMS